MDAEASAELLSKDLGSSAGRLEEGYLIELPKKGDLSKCANYRGITSFSTSLSLQQNPPGIALKPSHSWEAVLMEKKGQVQMSRHESAALGEHACK